PESTAPVDGVATHTQVEPGQIVQAGQGLLGVGPLESVWVTANFRETQLKDMKPGQKAEVKVDSYGKTFSGHVDSIAGATGSVMSLLPPENATGDFVKVVQRIPVTIVRGRIDQPLGDRADGDPGYVHGGAGHLDRKRVAAAHRRQSVGRRRSVNLGVDVLPGFERDYSAAVGLVFGAVGEEAVLHAVRGAVHGEFIFVRACTEPECAGAVPDSARRGWRWLAAERAGHSERHLPAREARHGLCRIDRKSTRLNSSHQIISYAVFCLKKKNNIRAL